MPDETKSEKTTDYLDQFWLSKVYPNVSESFLFEQDSIEAIKGQCIVVLDANVLLMPYRLGSHSLDEIRKVYAALSGEDRLFVPGQAAREFLRNRGNNIRDIVRTLHEQVSQITVPADKKVGFLDSDDKYQEFVKCSEQIRDLKKLASESIKALSAGLRRDLGSDPVSKLYGELLAENVLEIPMEDHAQASLVEEMEWRFNHSIPPGYKDRNKADDGIGDLLIWKAILQIGQQKEEHCIFVTEDAKGDWWVQSEGIFQPRIELVEEYRRLSGGKTIHLLPLSEFLQQFGAAESVIEETKITEVARRSRERKMTDIENTKGILEDSYEMNWIMKANLSALGRDSLLQLRSKAEELWTILAKRHSKNNGLMSNTNFQDLSDAEISAIIQEKENTQELLIKLNHRRKEIDSYFRNLYGKQGRL
ncbi:PIN domain-containing protein [Parasphingopyxis lamellibrachiae]|uniref:PIN like domain-containing protein n=1 Tax=Parasphingopyxis lamellibrachiae TaxID=680125 RepID=A0A3D9FHD9_9SPHN|nr:PIN domain-containing protein [Parasphingopyxis lamellibrachiae]RED16997.1 hypothetical protein DFR46_2031 [Parasphingopyxis lamellibrachiae]